MPELPPFVVMLCFGFAMMLSFRAMTKLMEKANKLRAENDPALPMAEKRTNFFMVLTIVLLFAAFVVPAYLAT